MAFTLVTLTAGSVGERNEDGSIAVGTITFEATAAMQNAGQIREPTRIVADLDNAGELKIGGQGGTPVVLPATDDAGTLPVGVTYTVTKRIKGASESKFQLAVPRASATLDLSTAVPAVVSTPAFPAVQFSDLGTSVVKYCSPAGNDINDGSSWARAKATFLAAYDALPAGGGTIYVTDGVSIGGSVANQGLWIAGPGDSQFNALPPGWRQQKDLHVIGVGNNASAVLAGRKGPQAGIGWGSGTDGGKPAIWITGTSTPFRCDDLGLRYPAVAIRAGVDSASPAPFTTLRNTNTSALWMENCSTSLNVGAGAGVGPSLDIGYVFWTFFDHCAFGANTAQADRTADNRAAVLVKPTGSSSGLLFFDHCIGYGGGIKYSPGNTTWGLEVNDFVTENDTGYAVWMTSTNRTGSAVLRDVQMADNPFAGAKTVQIDGSGPPEAVLCENVVDVTGPATILSSYPANWANANQTPAATGQVRLWQGRLAAQHDSDRRSFGPAAVRFANLANHDSSLWSVGSATITTGITAPDGTTGAVRLSTGLGGAQSRRPYGASLATSAGDWIIAGVWYRANNGATASTGGVGTIALGGGTFVGGLNYASLAAPLNGDGEWEWCSLAAQILTGGSSLALDLSCDSTHASDVYAPILLRIPNGTLSTSEVAELTQHLHPYPTGAPVGSVATYPYQKFYSGGPLTAAGLLEALAGTKLGTLTYTWPGAQGAGQVLTTDGAGNLTWTTLASSSDPWGFGFPFSSGWLAGNAATAVNIDSGAKPMAFRWLGAGAITKVGVKVGTSVGNICIATFGASGSGRAAIPGTRKATTGSIACPAAGYAEVAQAVTVATGDWLSVQMTAAATFMATTGYLVDGSNLYGGMGLYSNDTTFPIASTFPAVASVIALSQWAMVGVP